MQRINVLILESLPNFLWMVKKFLLVKTLGKAGKNVRISHHSTIAYPATMEVGNDVFIGPDFYCSAVKGAIIGDRVMFGAQVSIIGGDHRFDDPEENMRFNRKLGENNVIKLEADSWIGHGTLLLKNAAVGEGTIVGANSVVTQSLLPYSVYAGQPATFRKARFKSYEDLSAYLEMMRQRHGFSTCYSTDELKALYNGGDEK